MRSRSIEKIGDDPFLFIWNFFSLRFVLFYLDCRERDGERRRNSDISGRREVLDFLETHFRGF